MNDCRSIQLELSAYVDGELSGPALTMLEAHLAECPACRTQLEQLRQFAQGVAALPSLPVPPSFLGDVRQKIAARRNRSWSEKLFYPVWVKLPIVAAALVVVLATATILYRSSPPSPAPLLARAAQSPAPFFGVDGKGRKATILRDDQSERGRAGETAQSAPGERAELGREHLAFAPPAAHASTSAETKGGRMQEVPQTSADAKLAARAKALEPPPPIIAGDSAGVVARKTEPLAAESDKQQTPVVFAQIPLKTRNVALARQRVAGVTTQAQGRVLNWDKRRKVVQVELPASNVVAFEQALNPTPQPSTGQYAGQSAERLSKYPSAAGVPPAVVTSPQQKELASSGSVGQVQGGISNAVRNVLVEVQILRATE